jgi:Tfp pilus assembly protein PilP
MRLAKSSRTLLPLALSAVLATCAWAQDHPNIQPNSIRDQLNQAPSGSPAPAAPKPAPPAPAKPSGAATAKAPAKAPAKVAAATPAKAPAKTEAKASAGTKGAAKTASATPGKPPVEKPSEDKTSARRDPFDTLLSKARAGNAPPENLPPGKAGLIVDTLRINGIVHSPNGMIAIVSNAQQRVYFLREGDKLYDGSVQKIALDGISFNEIGKDAFGKPLERVVTKRLYPTPGEQQ